MRAFEAHIRKHKMVAVLTWQALDILGQATYLPHVKHLIVWYDGTCPLCRREISLIRRLDHAGAIEFVNAAGEDVSCPVDRADLMARFHASEEGVILSGAAAFAAMWRAVPLLWPLGLAARWPWVLALLERGYVRFLRIRPILQRIAALGSA